MKKCRITGAARHFPLLFWGSLCSAFFLFRPDADAAVYFSTNTAAGGANWSSSTTWTNASGVNGVPTISDDAVVLSGTKVIVDGTSAAPSSAKTLTVNASGTIAATNTTSTRVLKLSGNFTNNGAVAQSSSAGQFNILFAGDSRWVGSADLSSANTKIGITNYSSTTLDLTGITNASGLIFRATATGSSIGLFVNGTLITGTNVINLNNSSCQFSLAAGATLITANANGITNGNLGAIQVNGGAGAVTLSVSANYVFNGATNQKTLGMPATVANFTNANTEGVLALSAPVAVTGTASVNAGATLNFNGNNVTGSGSFLLAADGGVQITDPSGINASSASGNVQTAIRTFDSAAYYTYAGSAAQVAGTGLPATVKNLTLTNASGLVLSSSCTVSGILALASGPLTTTSSNLLTLGSSANYTGGASSNSMVNGPMARIYAGAGAASFPIGLNSHYRPVSLNLTAYSGPTTLSVTPHEPGTFGGSPSPQTTLFTNFDWTITSSVSAGTVATLTVDGTSFSPAGDAVLVGYNGAATTNYLAAVSADQYTASGIALASSWDFALGSVPCVPPAAPAITSVSPGCGSITVSWGAVSGVTRYSVYRKLSGDQTWASIVTVTNANAYADTSVSNPNLIYVYAVTALSGCESLPSAESEGVSPLDCSLNSVAMALQGAGRMLYTVPTNTFIENPSGDSGVKTINDTSGSIATVQSLINTTRSNFPNSYIVIRLTNNATYWVGSAGLVLGSRECLVASGAVIKATTAAVTAPLIQIAAGSTNVSVAGGWLDGSGANINGIFVPAADRVNVDRVTVVNCGLDGIAMNGNGNTNFDNELTVTRCEVSGCTNSAGISVSNATQAVCLENYCHQNATGISIGCARSTFANNICNSNGTGIGFLSGSDNVIANNTCNLNGTGILADGTNTLIVSCSLGGNARAGVNSIGSQNVFIDTLFKEGNATNYVGAASARDKILAYQSPLTAPDQYYFYPPLIHNPHTNAIVNAKGRTDVVISSATIDSVQSQYLSAMAANPDDVIVLHLNGTFPVGAAPLVLYSRTCVLLNGTLQVSGATTAGCVISNGTSSGYISISGGIIDGGNQTNLDGISFNGAFMAQVDAVRLQNFGSPLVRGSTDLIRYNGNITPMAVTRCTLTNGSARGIWLQQSAGKCLISANDVSAVNMDGVDCDSFTSGAVVKFNYCHDLLREGVFVEQGASYNVVLGNIFNNITNKGVNLYNNAITNTPVQYNTIVGNWCSGGNGLRNGSTPANSLTSHNFFFNNTLVNAAIQSQNYGTQNYYSQNYQVGAVNSLGSSGNEVFFNSIDEEGYGRFQDANSFLFAAVTNASTANGAAVILGFANSLASDQWQLTPADRGYYQIKNKNSAKVMNVSGASTNSGASVLQQTFGALQSDQWLPVSAGNGCYQFINRLSGLCLDVAAAGTAPGTRLIQQSFSGGPSQQFNLYPAALILPPTNLIYTVSGAALQLQWPFNYTGWCLQSQTNSLGLGLGNNWVDVPGSQLTNEWSANLQPASSAVFFRLRSP